MPLYEYSCRKCEHTFEVVVASRLTDEVQCPSCESRDLDRLIGLPARGITVDSTTNCQGNGPPCGAPWCGRKT
jgi:putative FmdB family regulatory protein